MPELNWIGKAAVVKHHKEVPFRLLENDPKLSCGDPDSGNLIVEGDITAERVRRVIEGYTDSKGKTVEGLGGGFQYCRLSSEPLFDAYGANRDDVNFAQLAEFVWFVETGTGYTPPKKPTPLLGIHDGRAIYLLYNGILQDRSDLGGNVLNQRTLAYLEQRPTACTSDR